MGCQKHLEVQLLLIPIVTDAALCPNKYNKMSNYAQVFNNTLLSEATDQCNK
jgi:hypothetical protein